MHPLAKITSPSRKSEGHQDLALRILQETTLERELDNT